MIRKAVPNFDELYACTCGSGMDKTPTHATYSHCFNAELIRKSAATMPGSRAPSQKRPKMVLRENRMISPKGRA
eukprot:scaffold11892_cov151-Skeletonema_dohrnii-CCMP3373.AAC.1